MFNICSKPRGIAASEDCSQWSVDIIKKKHETHAHYTVILFVKRSRTGAFFVETLFHGWYGHLNGGRNWPPYLDCNIVFLVSLLAAFRIVLRTIGGSLSVLKKTDWWALSAMANSYAVVDRMMRLEALVFYDKKCRGGSATRCGCAPRTRNTVTISTEWRSQAIRPPPLQQICSQGTILKARGQRLLRTSECRSWYDTMCELLFGIIYCPLLFVFLHFGCYIISHIVF